MNSEKIIGVVIPCYLGGEITTKLIENVLNYVHCIVLVDDACPFNTGKKVEEIYKNKNVYVLYNKVNIGVGGSTKIGFKYLIKKGFKVEVHADKATGNSSIKKVSGDIERKMFIIVCQRL